MSELKLIRYCTNLCLKQLLDLTIIYEDIFMSEHLAPKQCTILSPINDK